MDYDPRRDVAGAARNMPTPQKGEIGVADSFVLAPDTAASSESYLRYAMAPSLNDEDTSCADLLPSLGSRNLALHKRYLTVVIEVSFVFSDHLDSQTRQRRQFNTCQTEGFSQRSHPKTIKLSRLG